ncbi:MAG: Fic family protein [candidate division Zixibacteria bacterium]|nr:Fic family protein [candidate division Zixibacteria bacterium]
MAAVQYHISGFPPTNLNWDKLTPLLGPASAAIARFDGVLTGMLNARVLLSPLVTQEAVLSSKIEGTVSTMGEVLEFEAGQAPPYQSEEEKIQKIGDIYEIINYRKAIQQAEIRLSQLPLSGRLIREAHATLLTGVRGQNKAPGQYRKTQNWIGPRGCSVEEARFVPIPANQLKDAVTSWEHYIQSKQKDILVQLAIAHAEFEAIHPFLDGNGRLGRMLIPLFLYDRKLLSTPTFYISEFLESNRDEYVERLLAVSRDKDWTGWCVFFLNALLKQAGANTTKAKDILSLYEAKKSWVVRETHSQHAIRALDFVFGLPVFAASDFVKQSGIPEMTAKRIMRIFRDGGLLDVWRAASGQRPAILAFRELLNIAEGKSVF